MDSAAARPATGLGESGRGIAFDILGVQEGLAEAGEQDSNHGIERGGGPWRGRRITRVKFAHPSIS